MKLFSKFRMWAMLMVALMTIGTRAGAQVTNRFAYSGLGSPNPVGVNSNLSYTINWTNYSSIAVPFINVTNTLDVNSTFIGATIITNTLSLLPTTATNGNVVVFTFSTVGSNGFAQMSIIVKPTAAGLITNAVTYNVANATNFFATIINQVTNTVTPTQADLAVAITGPASAVFTNDLMTYGVNVTNLGPATATSVYLTNTLPSNVGYITNSLAIKRLGSGSSVVFNLGTLANGAFKNFKITVIPTNAGVQPFLAFVNSTSVTDPNPTNNLASNNITVGTFIYGQLIATNVYNPQMTYDPQIGLMTNIIRLTNIGTNAVTGARVIVSGVTNWLYNADGTNNGHPYVVCNTQLNPNQATNLVLEFFVPGRTNIIVTNYTAVITQTGSNVFNSPPVLPAIPTQTVNVLTLLTVTNTATEPNPNATTIGYGLISSPTNMSISTNGIITWTPAQNQSPSTNTITTVVTNSDPSDLANPQLTATNSFTVIVISFVLTGPTWLTNGDFQFVFNTGAGLNYTIQYSTNLMNWISISSFTSPGGLIPVQDPNAAASPWRFYRVRLNP